MSIRKQIRQEIKWIKQILEESRDAGEIRACVERKDVLMSQVNVVMDTQLFSNTVPVVRAYEENTVYHRQKRWSYSEASLDFAVRAMARSVLMDLDRLEKTTRLSTIAIKKVISGVYYVGDAILFLVKCPMILIHSMVSSLISGSLK